MKLILVISTILFIIGCERPKERCSARVYAVTATGQCIFDEYGTGACAVMLDNERATRFARPAVIGQKVVECHIGSQEESYFKNVKERNYGQN